MVGCRVYSKFSLHIIIENIKIRKINIITMNLLIAKSQRIVLPCGKLQVAIES